MRRTLRDLADARGELLEIQQEFVHLEKRIDAVRDCVSDSLTRIFGDERPAITALAEEELIERLAGRWPLYLGLCQPPRSRLATDTFAIRRRRRFLASASRRSKAGEAGRLAADRQ
jgi:hypothetical protein